MRSTELLAEAFARVRESVHEVVEGLSPEQLHHRIDPDANTLVWLVWHLARVEDDHITSAAAALGAGDAAHQVWRQAGFAERFDLPFEDSTIGYGMSSDEVARVRVRSGELLTEYYEAVHSRTLEFLRGVRGEDLDRVVDEQWDPPVTLAVRLVSVVNDTTQHVGQAAFLRGVVERTTG